MARRHVREFMKTKLTRELRGVPRPVAVRKSDFLRQLRRSTLKLLLELDALSRDHEVWSLMAVKTVNQSRLSHYVSFTLRHEPCDYDSLVVRLATDFSLGSCTSAKELWESFLRIGRFDFRWPIYYWFHQHVQFGYDWSADLLPLIRTAPRSEVKSFLRECQSKRDDFVTVAVDYLEDEPAEVQDVLRFFHGVEQSL